MMNDFLCIKQGNLRIQTRSHQISDIHSAYLIGLSITPTMFGWILVKLTFLLQDHNYR